MISELIIGGLYKIYLDQNKWPGIFYYGVISGITNKDGMENITDYNLKDELFTKYEYGTNTYITYTENCKLYILNQVTDLTTGTPSDESPIIIPHSMIDFTKSEKMVKISDISFTFTGIRRRFQDYDDLDSYLKTAKKDILKIFNYIDSLSGINLSISNSNSEIYVEESVIKNEENDRTKRLSSFRDANSLKKQEEESLRNKMVNSIKKYDELYKVYTEERNKLVKSQETNKQFYEDTMEYYTANNNFSKLMRETHKLMKEKAQELGISIKDYNEFIQEATGNIEQDQPPDPPEDI